MEKAHVGIFHFHVAGQVGAPGVLHTVVFLPI